MFIWQVSDSKGNILEHFTSEALAYGSIKMSYSAFKDLEVIRDDKEIDNGTVYYTVSYTINDERITERLTASAYRLYDQLEHL